MHSIPSKLLSEPPSRACGRTNAADAATAAAQIAVDTLKGRLNDVDDAANVLRNVVTVTALATDLPIDSAYKLLTTGNITA